MQISSLAIYLFSPINSFVYVSSTSKSSIIYPSQSFPSTTIASRVLGQAPLNTGSIHSLLLLHGKGGRKGISYKR